MVSISGILAALMALAIAQCFNLLLEDFEDISLIQKEIGISQQPSALNPKTNVKLRELQWGKLNFLQTTDTHAWYAGHLNQKNYGADWGDYISFVKHLRDYADSIGVDLLVVDSGDKHDGNGLSDASEINGEVSTRLFIEQDFDLLTIGNHELYLASSSEQEYKFVASKFQDRYLAANVQILDGENWVDIGSKYKLFTTKNQKLNVLALGFLFNFGRFNAQSRVRKVQETIKEEWFHNVLKDNVGKLDTIVVIGHLPVQRFDEFPEIYAIHKIIRSYYPDISVEYFGGHSHIRDYSILDDKAVALQSGRYCETVGFLGLNFDQQYQSNHKKDDVEFNRRYIDFNLYSFHTHSGKDYKTFPTKKGEIVTKNLEIQRELLNITKVFGHVPQNYLIIDNSYPGNSNLYTFLEQNILVRLVSDDRHKREANDSRVILINSGSIRYDMYKGPFTQDTMYIVSPFQNKWLYLPNLPLTTIKRVIDILNNFDYILSAKDTDKHASLNPDNLAPLEKLARNAKLERLIMSEDMIKNDDSFFETKLSKGYVTCDDAGCDGDDTPHTPYNYGKDNSPNIVRSIEIKNDNKSHVDLVFYDFLQPYITWALNQVNGYDDSHTYDFNHYGGKTVGEMLKDHVVQYWS